MVIIFPRNKDSDHFKEKGLGLFNVAQSKLHILDPQININVRLCGLKPLFFSSFFNSQYSSCNFKCFVVRARRGFEISAKLLLSLNRKKKEKKERNLKIFCLEIQI